MSIECLIHIETAWKQKTLAANTLFGEGAFDTALAAYIEALARAEILTKNSVSCRTKQIPFTEVFAISCTNLANVYYELDRWLEAETMHQRALFFLLHLLSKSSESEADQLHLHSQLRNLTLSYSEFLTQTKQEAKRSQLLRELESNFKKKN